MKPLKKLLEYLLKEESEDDLYHITYYNRLENISKDGLKTGARRSIGGASYDGHSAGNLFLTDRNGIKFWYNRAEAFAEHNSDNIYEDGYVPVVLKITKPVQDDELDIDDLGSRDSLSDAYKYQGNVEPEYIELWDGSTWISVEDWWDVDINQALNKTEEEDEDTGETIEYYHFKYSNQNPLIP